MNWRDEYPFESHWLNIGGQRMHYVDVRCSMLDAREGQAGDHRPSTIDHRPLLFLHGNPTWSFLWRRLIRHFAGSHRCVAPDHIGCGLSDKPQDYPYTLARHIDNACAFIEQLGLRDITMCVHDWGGPIGFGAAARMQERFSRFVVFNTAAFPSTRMPASIALARLPGVGALAIRGLNAFVRGALATCTAQPLARQVRAGFLAPYRSWRTRVANLRFVQDIPADNGHPSWPTLLEVERGLGALADKPMLLCWGGGDFVFTREFLDEWLRRFPRAWERYFPQAGHWVTEDAHEEIARAMEEFFNATASPVPGVVGNASDTGCGTRDVGLIQV